MEALFYIGISQSLFGGVMMALKKPNHLSDRILSAWLFFITMHLGFAFLNHTYQITSITFIVFVYGPLLYVYCRSLISDKPVFKNKYWLHFIPLLFSLIIAFLFREPRVFDLDSFFVRDSFFILRIIYAIMILASVLGYSIIAFVLINQHQHNLKEHFSFTSEKITLGWLKFVAISFGVFYLIIICIGIIDVLSPDSRVDVYIASYFVLAFYAFTFSIFGYQQARIYPDEKQIQKKKYLRSGLKTDDAELYLQALLKLMEKEKPYLNGDLNINHIAEKLHISRHYLTQIINEKLKKNFYTFVNEYRVDAVKIMLLNNKYHNYTLTSIGYECGFNSKSSFHSVFKMFTGYTPSKYKTVNKQ